MDKTVDVINPSGQGPFLLVCEHASAFIPEEFDNLGLPPEALTSHIAWDPGAYDVALHMSQLLDAPLVVQNVSRLVYDCNRPPSSADAMRVRSEIYDIPGNKNLTPAQCQARVDRFYEPFHKVLAAQTSLFAKRTDAPLFLTIHSFTPVYLGQKRDLELGILHNNNPQLASVLLGILGAYSKLRLGENQPYGPADGVMHTLAEHAQKQGLYNAMIEIRNDLIATKELANEIAETLSDAAMDAQYLFEQKLQ